jgi:hypothetical protein
LQAFVALAFDVGLHSLVGAEFLRHEHMGKGGVNAVVHPRQGLQRFGAGYARGRQKTALREFLVQVERDRHDLGDGFARHRPKPALGRAG